MFESAICRDDERTGGIQVITRAAKFLMRWAQNRTA